MLYINYKNPFYNNTFCKTLQVDYTFCLGDSGSLLLLDFLQLLSQLLLLLFPKRGGKEYKLVKDSVHFQARNSSTIASAWFLSRIIIASSAGRIAFARIGDRNLAHETINKLLVERQNNSSSTVIQQVNNSNADELRKYKQLFEEGIVTQDEYEAKKKQLLNL